ncbi:hypothetical protein BpHYR1_012524 [Brachionus plicatilis]|uniref:Uncharacterized protein n=1 Tax=Brachionus plicatilis TaxID=10195 RepID=A0A3M7SCS9_BRAPC|nr:hypothetical protein BpHYR1_012524 [Brachionus plicatilis]
MFLSKPCGQEFMKFDFFRNGNKSSSRGHVEVYDQMIKCSIKNFDHKLQHALKRSLFLKIVNGLNEINNFVEENNNFCPKYNILKTKGLVAYMANWPGQLTFCQLVAKKPNLLAVNYFTWPQI